MKTFQLLKPQAGLRVFISGAAAGIGAAVAGAFLEAGAAVFVCDVDPVALQSMQARHPDCFTGLADVAKADEVEHVIATGDWERTIDTNLNSQFYFLKHAVPVLKQSSDNASIIAISSVAGRLGYPYRTPYASTKWAIMDPGHVIHAASACRSGLASANAAGSSHRFAIATSVG